MIALYKDGVKLGDWPESKAEEWARELGATIGGTSAPRVRTGRPMTLGVFHGKSCLLKRRKELRAWMVDTVRAHIVALGGECRFVDLPATWMERVRQTLKRHPPSTYGLAIEGWSSHGEIGRVSVLRAVEVPCQT